MGSVSQDDMLYAGSLAENISLVDAEIDMARVYEVARLACVHHDILSMPLQYDSLVGDMGFALSGGQKQRVLIARALYGRPDIHILDEGAAHLDPDTEARVLASLKKLEIARVVIAHRAQSVAAADRTIAIADGRATLVSASPSSMPLPFRLVASPTALPR